MMRTMFAVLFQSSLLIGFPWVESLQTPRPKTPPPAGWVLTMQVDKLTDVQSFTIVRRSNEGTASVGIHCGGGSYTAFIVVPKTLGLGTLTLADVRFDKREVTAFALQRIDTEFLVSFIGGSKTDANFVFMTDDV